MGREIKGVMLLTWALTAALPPHAQGQAPRPQPAPATGPAAPRTAAPATAPPAVRPPVLAHDPQMKPILQEWERRSARLTSLRVKINRLDKDPAWNENNHFEGDALLKSPNLAWLDFRKEEKDPRTGKSVMVNHERIICTGQEVWQYKSNTKQIFIFPLDKENQKRALEEGPLPFLFNMKAADAEARYTMNLLNRAKDYFVIGVWPKLKIDKESFSQALLKLNNTTYFPDRILLISPDGKSTKDFTLSNVQPNLKIEPKNFQGVLLGKPWQVVRDPAEDAGPPRRLGNQPTAPAGAAPRRR